MTLAQRVEVFFKGVEDLWEVVPSQIKVFLYSTSSSIVGLWAVGELDPKAVALIVLANMGIYQVPRTVGTQVKKIL